MDNIENLIKRIINIKIYLKPNIFSTFDPQNLQMFLKDILHFYLKTNTLEKIYNINSLNKDKISKLNSSNINDTIHSITSIQDLQDILQIISDYSDYRKEERTLRGSNISNLRQELGELVTKFNKEQEQRQEGKGPHESSFRLQEIRTNDCRTYEQQLRAIDNIKLDDEIIMEFQSGNNIIKRLIELLKRLSDYYIDSSTILFDIEKYILKRCKNIIKNRPGIERVTSIPELQTKVSPFDENLLYLGLNLLYKKKETFNIDVSSGFASIERPYTAGFNNKKTKRILKRY